jgi:hypothetical protein
MLSILLVMGLILVLAAAIVLYVAFPRRGQDVPHASWVGDAMKQGVKALPTLDNQRDNQREGEHKPR